MALYGLSMKLALNKLMSSSLGEAGEPCGQSMHGRWRLPEKLGMPPLLLTSDVASGNNMQRGREERDERCSWAAGKGPGGPKTTSVGKPF